MADNRKIRDFVERWTGRGYEKGEAVNSHALWLPATLRRFAYMTVMLGLKASLSTMAADGREDVVEHPRLELLGGGQIGGDNQPVQVALADEPDLLDATSRLKGVVIHDPLTVTRQGIFRVGVAEGGGDIPTAEQDLPAGGDGSDRAELVVGERL